MLGRLGHRPRSTAPDAPGFVIVVRRTEAGWVEDRTCWGSFVDEIAACLADLPNGVAEDLALVGDSQTLDPGGGDPATWAAECSSPPLHRGDSGVCVTRLQSLLVGLFGAPIVIDGHFGPATEASLTSLQTNAGLEADGYAGPATWAVFAEAAGPR